MEICTCEFAFDRQSYIKIALLLELNTNQSLKEAAKEQAGLKQDKDFQITDFNYNVVIVAELLKKHLSKINFNGASVCIYVYYHVLWIPLNTEQFNRGSFDTRDGHNP